MPYISTLKIISSEENPFTEFSVELHMEDVGTDRQSTLAEQIAVALRMSLNDPDFVLDILDKLDRAMENFLDAEVEQNEDGN